jgi:hypothetical protein
MCPSAATCLPAEYCVGKGIYLFIESFFDLSCNYLSEWLFIGAKGAIFQLSHGESGVKHHQTNIVLWFLISLFGIVLLFQIRVMNV